MPRVRPFRRLPPVLMSALALSLAACGSEPAREPADAGVPAPETEPPAFMPADAPPQEEAPMEGEEAVASDATTCRSTLGETASARLVQRCIAVSPATHPPCNAENPCELIQGEIDRACAQYGPDETRPAECEG